MVGSQPFLHLRYVEICERGLYYCVDEDTNYDEPHDASFVVVVQSHVYGAFCFHFKRTGLIVGLD